MSIEAKLKDPVCGMEVDETDLAHDHAGRTYHFCNPKCREKFKADPRRYLGDTHDDEPPAPAGAKYTCPMHPEIVQDAPGSCPICGMTLEPMMPSADEPEDAELADMKRRLLVSAALTLPVFVGEMAGMKFGHILPPKVMAWVQLALATPVVLWGGWPFF